jgi:undecaprenyl-diphosphatase
LPAPAEAPPHAGARFDVDPVADGALILGAGGFAWLLDEVNSTGEIRPQQISPTFDKSQLLGIDRIALSENPDGNSGMLSNVGLFAAIGFAVVDPVLSGIREKNVQSGIVDALMYAESASITWGLTNLAKMAVRRPRPLAYIDAERHKGDPNYSNADTDSTLSFFSGHSSITATLTATATYLAFARAPHTARPWLTLLAGTALTTFVSAERVMSAKHFPTDVIAGAMAGAGVGLLVPLIHRSEGIKQRVVWVGFAPAEFGKGGVLQAGGPL